MRFSIMDRFDFDAQFKKKESVDDEMLTPVRSDPVSIKVHEWGEELYIRGTFGEKIVDAKHYLIPKETVEMYNIQVEDMINDQPIKALSMYPIPSGRVRRKQKSIYEALTYKT